MVKRSKSDWLSLISEFESSGESAAAFCRSKGLCAKYFSLRRRQLKGTVSNPFIPVVPPPSQGIELRINSVNLSLPVSISPDWLAQLIKGLDNA